MSTFCIIIIHLFQLTGNNCYSNRPGHGHSCPNTTSSASRTESGRETTWSSWFWMKLQEVRGWRSCRTTAAEGELPWSQYRLSSPDITWVKFVDRNFITGESPEAILGTQTKSRDLVGYPNTSQRLFSLYLTVLCYCATGRANFDSGPRTKANTFYNVIVPSRDAPFLPHLTAGLFPLLCSLRSSLLVQIQIQSSCWRELWATTNDYLYCYLYSLHQTRQREVANHLKRSLSLYLWWIDH